MATASVKLILVIAVAFSILALISLCASASEDHKQVGSGDDDWWVAHPAKSAASGSAINHPTWVLDALKEKPVVIYVHMNCATCKPQTEALNEIVQEFKDKFTFYDFDGSSGEAMANDAVVYDPDGAVAYVPLTVILTLAPDSEGNVDVVWHSTENATGKDWIKAYVEDAIYYYEQNSGSWKP